MRRSIPVFALVLLCTAGVMAADEYRAEALGEAAPADELDGAIADTLNGEGFSVIKGTSRTLCNVWFTKAWSGNADFTASAAELYPLVPGSLVGVVQFKSDGEDFRAQEIEKGVYTIRFGLQPVDGNHIGTSDTRDFFLLLPAGEDTSPDVLTEDDLNLLSAEAAGTTHPAMLSLLRIEADDREPLSMSHDEARELWSVRLANPLATGSDTNDLAVEMVVVGHAEE